MKILKDDDDDNSEVNGKSDQLNYSFRVLIYCLYKNTTRIICATCHCLTNYSTVPQSPFCLPFFTLLFLSILEHTFSYNSLYSGSNSLPSLKTRLKTHYFFSMAFKHMDIYSCIVPWRLTICASYSHSGVTTRALQIHLTNND